MKKILFDLGNVSQIPSIISPVYQYADVDIIRNPELLKAVPIIDTGTISDYIPMDKLENLPWVTDFDEKFEKMQDSIEFVDFSKSKEVENLLNEHLSNFNNRYEKNKFKQEFYKNLNLIKNKEINLSEIREQYIKDLNHTVLTENNLEVKEKNDFNDLYNLNYNAGKSNNSNNHLSQDEKEKIIEEALKDPKIKAEFLKLQNEAKSSVIKLDNFLNKYQSLYDANKVFNIISATLASVSWALFLSYSAAAFWTFGATIPLAASAGLQSSIMTIFVYESFESQKAIEEDLNRIKNFKNSTEYERIIKFSGMSFEEFKANFKKELKAKKPDLIFIYNILNLATKNSAVKMVVKHITQNLKEMLVSKIVGKLSGNQVFAKSISKIIFKKSFFSASESIIKLSTTIGTKRAILFTTSFANPLGSLVSALDSLLSGISVITNIAINYQLKYHV